ncbi:MAG: aminotransferase [Lentisphaerae bacterium GWF2_49_21]|nr:MAG: aminotransferase [Lentisphaerae bacterium GWF2_49_21]
MSLKAKNNYDNYMITGMVAGFQPVEVENAFKCTITDSQGKDYLDCFSGISVVNAGHNHPKIQASAKKQIDKFIHCCTYVYYNPRAGEIAAKLAEITPGKLQKSFLGNSGAEAVEGALRIAKQHCHKKEIICLTQSFHGRTVGTLSITGNRGRKKGSGPYLSGIAFAPAPNCYRCPFRQTYPGCGTTCAHFMSDVINYQTSGDVAAFIAEPIMGEGGIIVPPPEYFKIIKEILESEGILFIADEVQSGFGRTGKMFAIEHYGVEPEIMCMAKGIANGYPLSSFIVTPDIAEAFTPGDHLSTFGGNPVSCAAAVANIEVLQEEKLLENAEKIGRWLMSEFSKLAKERTEIGDVRGKGLMIGIELIKDSGKKPAAELAKAVRKECLENGVLIGVGGTLANVLRLQPPLCITQEEAEKAFTTIKKSLTKLGYY